MPRRSGDFGASTKRVLAQRAGSQCSFPGCGRATQGAALGDDEKVLNVGDAAHITAASRRGPRYDPAMTDAQRKHISNGIWMCKHHANLIDADDSQYSVDDLRAWKSAAEARSALHLALRDVRDGDGIYAKVPIDVVRHSVLGMAASDLVAQRRSRSRAEVEVPLLLRLHRQDGADPASRPIACAELGAQLGERTHIAIVSGPGTGKSTALQQLAEAINVRGGIAAVTVNLPDWNRSSTGLLETVALRHAFSSAAAPLSQLRYLAALGRLALLVDGWNELDAEGRQRVNAAMRALYADYPELRIVVSTRHLDTWTLPSAPVVYKVEPLTRDQRRRIAHGIAGDDGLDVLARAEATEGLENLLRVPLFLKALLTSVNAADPIPSTKQALLERWSSAQERASQERGNRLDEMLDGAHHDLLVALAEYARRLSVTTLTASAASSAISPMLADLQAQQRIAPDATARRVLGVLVDEHLLERSGDGAVRFQHHQLQEWYASYGLEATMRRAMAGDIDAHTTLRDVLNWRVHDESVLFACERLASSADGIAIVATTIRLALELDPLLAADIIHVAPAAWSLVRDEVLALVRRHHRPGVADTAVAFMTSAGCLEFAEFLAPLFGSADLQTVLHALRAGHRLDVALLGANAVDAVLRFRHRDEVVLELANRAGSAGVDCAVAIAARSGDDALIHTLAVDLYWEGRDQALLRLLPATADASCEPWRKIAERIVPEADDPSDLAELLRRVRRELHSQNGSPMSRLKLLREAPERPSDFDEQLTAILRDPAFDIKIVEHDPELREESAWAAIARMEDGLSLWHGAAGLARERGLIVESARLQAILLNPDTPTLRADFAAMVAGPIAVTAALAQLVAIPIPRTGARELPEAAELWRRLRQSPLSSLATALVAYRDEQDAARIGQLAELLSTWRSSIVRNVDLDPVARDQLTDTLSTWAERLIVVQADRSHAAHVASAMGSASDQRLVVPLSHLLKDELERASQERSAVQGGDITARDSARMSYTNLYRDALVQIGGDAAVAILKAFLTHPDFAREAAGGLVMLRRGGMSSILLGNARARRTLQPTVPPDPFALAILAAAENLAHEPNTRALALRLAATAMSLPGGDPSSRVAALLALDADRAARLDLFAQFAFAGGVLQASELWVELRALLADHRPWGPRAEQILALFAWSDSPCEAIEALVNVRQANLFTPETLSTLLGAIAQANRDGCEGLLLGLADADPSILSHHSWWNALESVGGAQSARRCLALINEPTREAAVYGNSSTISQLLAREMQRHADLRAEVYHDAATSRMGTILWEAIAQAPDADGILTLVRHGARAHADLRGWIGNGLNQLALSRSHSSNSPGTSIVSGVAQNELRRELFHLSGGEDPGLANKARDVLRMLQELRAVYSPLDEEPRHPDLAYSAPWPLW